MKLREPARKGLPPQAVSQSAAFVTGKGVVNYRLAASQPKLPPTDLSLAAFLLFLIPVKQAQVQKPLL